jgi:hypothetical protein
MQHHGSDPRTWLFCSFCGKSQHEVRKLIAGPTVFICNECVESCVDILKEPVEPDLLQRAEMIVNDNCVERCVDILHKEPVEPDLLQHAEMIVTGTEIDCGAFLSTWDRGKAFRAALINTIAATLQRVRTRREPE